MGALPSKRAIDLKTCRQRLSAEVRTWIQFEVMKSHAESRRKGQFV